MLERFWEMLEKHNFLWCGKITDTCKRNYVFSKKTVQVFNSVIDYRSKQKSCNIVRRQNSTNVQLSRIWRLNRPSGLSSFE